jgi:amino acid transporter/mannitol/fructose-specific phosphotransferase system IIA component (Ntr-type)
MTVLKPSERLTKELSLLNVYAISLGATLSSGFFLLPGIAAAEAGPAVVLTYLVALLPLIPGILSKVELSTAMPRAGGVYYFIDRSIGPLWGTIGGIGTWLALALKVAFALIGMGAYLELLWSGVPIKWLAIGLAVAFGVLNIFGARKSGRIQLLLVAGLLVLLTWFVGRGVPEIQVSHFDGFFDKGGQAILSTAGLVCISYIGLSKVISVSEEVREPEKTLPRAIFLAVATAVLVYAVGTTVMVGVLGRGLEGNLTPVAKTAEVLAGETGRLVMIVAAVLAFFSVANAGILSASRYPLAMSRDQLMPTVFQTLGRFGTPVCAIGLTVGLIVATILFLDPLRIAKLAGAFQLALFALNCLAVIVMRESRIASYDPGYRVPFYPWLQIVGVAAPLVLIYEMGWMPALFTAGIAIVGAAWFVLYGMRRVSRHGAIRQLFSRLGSREFDDLDRELRGILKEKGLREHDPFDEIVIRSVMIDLPRRGTFESAVREASDVLARQLSVHAGDLSRGFMEGTRTGLTPVSGGVALPHLRLPGMEAPAMAVVRCRQPIGIQVGDVFGHMRPPEDIHAIFFLVSPEEDPGQHLRLLAQLASRVDEEGFMHAWLDARDEQHLKEILLRDDRFLALELVRGQSTEALIGKSIGIADLPDGCLVAVIRREDRTIIPRGRTVLHRGDRLTIIGTPAAIIQLAQEYGPEIV